MYKDLYNKLIYVLFKNKFKILLIFILYILLFLWAIFIIINIPIAKINDFEIKKNHYLLYTVKNIDNNNTLKTRTIILSYHLFLDEFKTGFYNFENKNISLYDLFYKMNNNIYSLEKLLIKEGLTNSQIKKILYDNELLVGEITSLPGEGELFPNTYYFAKGDNRQDIINSMHLEFKNIFKNQWEKRNKNIPLKSIEEAFILASMVEKETSIEYEKPYVSSVFYNRLNKGMRLQSDPTVIYGITKGDLSNIKILKSHLKNKNDWNTYYIKRLPKTPISNFSISTMDAVLNPKNTDFYYFVAKPDNIKGHNFSKTLDEHNKYVKLWRKWKNAKNK